MITVTTTSDDILIISDDQARAARTQSLPPHLLVERRSAASCSAGCLTWASRLLPRERWQSECADNLRQIGRALNEYHEAHDQFPAPVSTGRDCKPLLSWRVAILPRLGYQSLYERFHLDEPWDSPHNRSLLTEMPHQFGCPAPPERAGGQNRLHRGRRAGDGRIQREHSLRADSRRQHASCDRRHLELASCSRDQSLRPLDQTRRPPLDQGRAAPGGRQPSRRRRTHTFCRWPRALHEVINC